ncbi:MAG TPA: hypothetical protein VJJ26_01460 [Candidatus Babeliales bacterium]|nr:hypothetical protein [Candidatus Babeliales bacterium]
MKLLKNILFTMALFAINYVDARGVGPTKQQQPAKKVPTISFKNALVDVRKMTKTFIFDLNQNFTKAFIRKITDFNLNAEFMRALFEAAANLHLPLSGNNDADEKLSIQVRRQIDVLVPYEEIPLQMVEKDAVKKTELIFYDDITDSLNQDFLENRVKQELKTKDSGQIIPMLKKEYSSRILIMWDQRKLKNINQRMGQLNEQIENTVRELEKQQIEAGQLVLVR